MQLTRHTDYSLRVLIYLALYRGERVTISDIARAFNVSRNHLLKIIRRLNALGFVATMRGKGGGLRLARDPDAIRVGEVVRGMEGSLEIIDCAVPACPILPSCVLKGAIDEARDAFLQTLDGYTVSDLLARRETRLMELLSQ